MEARHQPPRRAPQPRRHLLPGGLLLSEAVTLRDARPEDAPRILAWLEAEELEVAFVPQEMRVAEAGGVAVGAVRLKPLPDGTHELASLVVDPARRGAGLGARLVEDALARAPGRVVGLALRPRWFERFGFRILDAVPDALAEKASGECGCTCSTATPIARDAADEVSATVRARYANAAVTGRGGNVAVLASRGYAADAVAALPEDARYSLGTGNPVAAAELRPGETVVDLGSGAGLDVLLAARAVGRDGRAIGVDFTPEMIARARRNAEDAGAANATFVEAPLDATGLPAETADVVVSNCVLNLAPDKTAALAEAYRILKPGGRLVVSDTLREEGTAPGAITCDCVGGALTLTEWERALTATGFVDAAVAPEVADDACCGGTGRALVRARKA